MARQTSLEKMVTILAKLPLPECLELYMEMGRYLYQRFEEGQKQLQEKHKELEIMKSKINEHH